MKAVSGQVVSCCVYEKTKNYVLHGWQHSILVWLLAWSICSSPSSKEPLGKDGSHKLRLMKATAVEGCSAKILENYLICHTATFHCRCMCQKELMWINQCKDLTWGRHNFVTFYINIWSHWFAALVAVLAGNKIMCWIENRLWHCLMK